MRPPLALDLHLPSFNFPGVAPEAEFDKGMTVSLPDVHDAEALELVGRTIAPTFSDATRR